jgi:hypothetical protein
MLALCKTRGGAGMAGAIRTHILWVWDIPSTGSPNVDWKVESQHWKERMEDPIHNMQNMKIKTQQDPCV